MAQYDCKKAWANLLGVTKTFCILIVRAVIELYTFVTIQQTIELERVNFILFKLHINESDFLKISIECFTKFRIPMQNSMQNNLSGRMDDQLLTMDTEIRG